LMFWNRKGSLLGACLLVNLVANLAGITGKSTTRGPPNARTSPLRYFVLGDWGSIYNTDQDYADSQKAVALQMAASARIYKPSFIISVGDNFYDYGVNSTEDLYWKDDFEDVYSDPLLQVPWYITLGNHDYMGRVEAQLQYSNKSPRWKLPDRNYTLVVNIDGTTKVTFIFLDTSPFVHSYYTDPETPEQYVQLSSQHYLDQLKWFHGELKKAAAVPNNWIVPVGHHNYDVKDIELILVPFFEQYEVPVYIAGHTHALQYYRNNNVDYLVSGAGSRVEIPTDVPPNHKHKEWTGDDPGFLVVEMFDTEMLSTFINYEGDVLYEVTTFRNETRR